MQLQLTSIMSIHEYNLHNDTRHFRRKNKKQTISVIPQCLCLRQLPTSPDGRMDRQHFDCRQVRQHRDVVPVTRNELDLVSCLRSLGCQSRGHALSHTKECMFACVCNESVGIRIGMRDCTLSLVRFSRCAALVFSWYSTYFQSSQL